MIEDEEGLISIDQFDSLFMSYFKGEEHAKEIKNLLLPAITITKTDSEDKLQPYVKISKFTSFIDMFNFFPVPVNKIHYKNDSNEVNFVMNTKNPGQAEA